MIVLQTVAVAFSMFSALPMPQIEWNDKNMRWSLCAFPLVGVLIGLGCWGWLRRPVSAGTTRFHVNPPCL